MHAETTVGARGERFGAEVDLQRQTLTLTDFSSDARWHSGRPFVRLRIPGEHQEKPPYFGFPAPSEEIPWKPEQLTCTTSDAALSLRLTRIPVGADTVEIRLAVRVERERVRFEVEAVEGLQAGTELVVDFPYRLGAAHPGDAGYLILPRGAGLLADFSADRESVEFENFIYSSGQNGFSMPIFGTMDRTHILGAVVKTPYDCLLRAELNAGEPTAYAIAPCWLFEGGRLTYPRRVDYAAFRGGYVELARWYRSDLIAEGRYRTLAEKAEGHPQVRQLYGAILAEMHLIFAGDAMGKPVRAVTPYELVNHAQALGFDRLVSYSVGVWQRPYYGPHAVPPEEGTEEDLAAAARYAKEKGEGYTMTVYDNFVDILPSSPEYDERITLKRRDGTIRPNWFVRHLDLWTHTVCPVHRAERARKHLPALQRLIGKGSIYIDVEGAVELMECFDSAHPVTREADCALRRELLHFTKELFGTVATESMPIDCLADVVDVGAYFPVYQFTGYGCSDRPKIEPPMIPIPLYMLVYHGSVISTTPGHGTFYTCDPLYVPLWGMLPSGFDDLSKQVSRKMRQTCEATMEEHRFLTGPHVDTTAGYHAADLQLSRFSDGTYVLANFSEGILQWEGHVIGPNDFLIGRE